MGASARPGNYEEQAKTYDLTRGASPAVVRAITAELGPPEARSLIDIAGGTGNYAQVLAARGFRVTLVDASSAMAAHASRKLGLGAVIAADAENLPFGERSFDCGVVINAIHLLGEPLAALAEARRVLRRGPLVVTAFTNENLRSLFVFEYFGVQPPAGRTRANAEFRELLAAAGFGRISHRTFVYTDTADGSLASLHTSALRLAGRAYLRNTSFWHGLDGETRRRGLEALARDLRSGELERRVWSGMREAATSGHGTIFTGWP